MNDILAQKKCSVCGVELVNLFSRRTTCSKECATIAKSHSGENHPRWQGRKNCVICDKELIGSVTRNNQTCSSECGRKLSSRVRKGEKNTRWKSELDKKCLQCDKSVERKSHRKFCSRKCSADWQSQNKSKENSPLWKGGSAYAEYPPEFNSKFRAKIRKRDGYLCGVCKKKSWSLDVHHIDGNKKNTSEENMISLCRSCHGKVHWNPGLLKTSRKEFLCKR